MARRSQTGRQVWWRVSTSCFYFGDFFPLANNLSSAVMFCGHCTLSYLGVLSYRFFPLSFHLFRISFNDVFPLLCHLYFPFVFFIIIISFYSDPQENSEAWIGRRRVPPSRFPFFSLLSRFLSRLGEDNDDLVLLNCPSSFFPFYSFYLSLSNGH